jgi:hypothetical protein
MDELKEQQQSALHQAKAEAERLKTTQFKLIQEKEELSKDLEKAKIGGSSTLNNALSIAQGGNRANLQNKFQQFR